MTIIGNGYVYLMYRKFNALINFKEFKAGLERHSCKNLMVIENIKVVMSTCKFDEFDTFHREHEIIAQLSTPRNSNKMEQCQEKIKLR